MSIAFELRVGKIYRIYMLIGSGGFGDIFYGHDTTNDEEVAIKLELLKSKNPQLLIEYEIYKSLHGTAGVPAVRYCGVDGPYNALVMDMLGKSLDDLFSKCSYRFSLSTVLIIADQCLTRLESIHNQSLIHRDVKPDNFLIGRGSNSQMIYVIDFGCAKYYRDPDTLQHIPCGDGTKGLIGTARYASLNAHVGIELSRRDDLESLGYMLVYFLSGSLPWQQLQAETVEERYQRVFQVKSSTSIESLCEMLPKEFETYLTYVKSLEFADRPDYDYLRGLFQELYAGQDQGQDQATSVTGLFDWEVKTNGKYQEISLCQSRRQVSSCSTSSSYTGVAGSACIEFS